MITIIAPKKNDFKRQGPKPSLYFESFKDINSCLFKKTLNKNVKASLI